MKNIKVWMICGALMVAAVAGCGGSAEETASNTSNTTGTSTMPGTEIRR